MARKSRRKYTSRFLTAIKKIRSALAKLKRKKIIPKSLDVRRALPDAKTRSIIRRNKAVVEGKATTFKIPDDAPKQLIKDLKSLGYKVIGKGDNRRIIVPTSQYVRKGRVYERPTRSRKGYRIEREKLDIDRITDQVNAALKGLKAGDLAGFEVGDQIGKGGRSFNLYSSASSMLRDLMAYQERGFKFTHLAVFRVTQAKQREFIQDSSRRARERVLGSPERRAARKRSKPKTGMRTSRGH